MRQAMGLPAGEHGLSSEIVKTNGPPGANDPAPRSDAPAVANADPFARPNSGAAADPNELKPAAAPDPNELKPDPNELKPTESQNAIANEIPAPAPTQINEIQQPAASSSNSGAAASSSSTLASDKDISTSKKKKKKGLKKLIPTL
jgi:hypothetical protein